MNALKQYGIACKNAALSTSGKVATGAMLLAANSAFAQESEIATAINAAKSTALSNVGLAVAAVIGVAALVMGIGVVLGLIKR